jgi:hypothetical protein
MSKKKLTLAEQEKKLDRIVSKLNKLHAEYDAQFQKVYELLKKEKPKTTRKK